MRAEDQENKNHEPARWGEELRAVLLAQPLNPLVRFEFKVMPLRAGEPENVRRIHTSHTGE